MARWLSLILVALACAVGLAACGGGDDAGDDDPRALLRQTFGADKPVKSARLDLSLHVSTDGLAGVDGPLALRLSGPFVSKDDKTLPRFDVTAQIQAASQSLEIGAVSTGKKGYLTVQGVAYELSDELYREFADGFARQAECADRRDGGVTLRALGIDPGRWLTNPEKAGTDEVGGADTIHVTAGIDVPRFLQDVNRIIGRTGAQPGGDPCAENEDGGSGSGEGKGRRQLSEAEREAIAEGVKDAKVDVWVGEEDRLLRRLRLAIAFEVPKEERGDLNGLRSGEVTFDLTLGALNEDQDIEAPEDARPLSELQGALSGIAGGTSSGAGGGEGGGASRSRDESSQYLQCLQDAGQDVKELQKCANLVGR